VKSVLTPSGLVGDHAGAFGVRGTTQPEGTREDPRNVNTAA